MDRSPRKVTEFEAGAFAQWVDLWNNERTEGLSEELPVFRGTYQQSRTNEIEEKIIYV